MPVTNLKLVTIESGQSVSNVITLSEYETIVSLEVPSTFTTAPLTFRVTSQLNSANVADLYKDNIEFSVSGLASRKIVLDPLNFLGARRIQIRSGTSSSAVNQTGTRELILTTVEM